jgi:hypothetical protein
MHLLLWREMKQQIVDCMDLWIVWFVLPMDNPNSMQDVQPK